MTNTLNATLPEEFLLHIHKEIDIDAPISFAYEALLDQLGPGSDMPNGQPFPMKFEPWPGGRWFRDLGNNTGHLWGHVQVIKPPTLIEIYGPLMMSYPAISHVQYRLTEQGNRTLLSFTHRALGEITQDHREGVQRGWTYRVEKIRELAEKAKNAGGGAGKKKA
jgi:hypothetical protein